MFRELARTQAGMASRFSAEIAADMFPHASLLVGSRYSGRMTAALELARTLSCRAEEGKGEEQCRCVSCQAFRQLENTNLIVISSRDHQSVIETALANFQRQRNESSRLFLLRSVRILLLQYHGALMDQATQKNQASYDSAAQASELLMDLATMDSDASTSSADKLVKNLRAALKPLLAASRKNTSISIAQVRAIQEWIGLTAMDGAPRIVIIEALEQATEGARNSLLKMLEEPPENVWYILLTENPGRIMQTILSRVRKYYFPMVNDEGRKRLLQECFFAQPEQYDSMETYFLSNGGLDCKEAVSLARRFLDGVMGRSTYENEDLAAFAAWVDESGQHAYVFRELLLLLEQDYLAGRIDASKAKALSGLISGTLNRAALFNQNRKLAIEGLYYQSKEIVR